MLDRESRSQLSLFRREQSYTFDSTPDTGCCFIYTFWRTSLVHTNGVSLSVRAYTFVLQSFGQMCPRTPLQRTRALPLMDLSSPDPEPESSEFYRS